MKLRFAAIILAALLAAPPSLAVSGGGSSMAGAVASATVTEARGNIFKRGFVDWAKDRWGDPEKAQVGDRLHEGMQLGTGRDSWAQVSWPNVTTRAWSNTIFAIAPNQKLVYLMDGEMLFNLNKHRKDKGDYVVWTKVLQARIRGTTVLVQATGDLSRITVLEGCVEVMNRLDRSIIRITPGVVYEVRTSENRSSGNDGHFGTVGRQSYIRRGPGHPRPYSAGSGDEPAGEAGTGNTPPAGEEGSSSASSTSAAQSFQAGSQNDGKLLDGDRQLLEGRPGNLLPAVNPGQTADSAGAAPGSLTEIWQADGKSYQVFQTNACQTSLYTASADVLAAHPLVKGFESPLPSLSLVETSLSAIAQAQAAGSAPPAGRKEGTERDLVCQNSEIMRVPVALSYKIGPSVGHHLPVPAASLNHFAPAGIIGQEPEAGSPHRQPGGNFDHGAGKWLTGHNLPGRPGDKLPFGQGPPRTPGLMGPTTGLTPSAYGAQPGLLEPSQFNSATMLPTNYSPPPNTFTPLPEFTKGEIIKGGSLLPGPGGQFINQQPLPNFQAPATGTFGIIKP